MSKFGEIIKSWFYRTLLCFTLLVTGFAVVGLSFNPMNTLFCSQILYLLLFSALIGVSFGVASGIKANQVLKASVEFVCSYLSFVLCFYVLDAGKNFAASSNAPLVIIATTLLFIGVYAVVAVLVSFAKKIINSAKVSKQEYESQFDIKE